MSDIKIDGRTPKEIRIIAQQNIANLTDKQYDYYKQTQNKPKEPRKYEDGGAVGGSGVIRIEIDLGAITGNEGYDMEDDVCPIATQDEELNAENREVAEDDYSYGEATSTWENKNAKCRTCEYYDMSDRMMDCIGSDEDVGYCTKLHFVCSAENVCNLWELGVPKSEMNPGDDGNSRDIF